jgi:hypothetical protein
MYCKPYNHSSQFKNTILIFYSAACNFRCRTNDFTKGLISSYLYSIYNNVFVHIMRPCNLIEITTLETANWQRQLISYN